jgi:hypothetical protein
VPKKDYNSLQIYYIRLYLVIWILTNNNKLIEIDIDFKFWKQPKNYTVYTSVGRFKWIWMTKVKELFFQIIIFILFNFYTKKIMKREKHMKPNNIMWLILLSITYSSPFEKTNENIKPPILLYYYYYFNLCTHSLCYFVFNLSLFDWIIGF